MLLCASLCGLGYLKNCRHILIVVIDLLCGVLAENSFFNLFMFFGFDLIWALCLC